MKVSVVVPTYKPQTYLWDCLRSLINQTMDVNDYEVLIVLNGCGEPYKRTIEQWISSNSRANFFLFQTEEAGVSNARNIALDHTRGDYIAFIDDDDFVSPNYLEELFNHASIDTTPVCRPLSFVDGTNEYRAYNVTKDYDKYNTKGKVPFNKPKRFFNGPVYKLIHKSIIGNRRFDIRFKNGEDSLFMFLISDRIKYVEFADASAIYYRRIRPNSATQIKKPFGYAIKNYSKLMIIQTSIFIKDFPRYNFYFFFNSIVGRIKSILCD